MGDEVASTLVKNLQVALIFYRDVYNLKEQIDMDILQLGKDENLTGEIEFLLSRNTIY